MESKNKLSDLIFETAVNIEKAQAVYEELANFFELSPDRDKEQILFSYMHKSKMNYILGDYLMKIDKQIEIADKLIGEICKKEG